MKTATVINTELPALVTAKLIAHARAVFYGNKLLAVFDIVLGKINTISANVYLSFFHKFTAFIVCFTSIL